MTAIALFEPPLVTDDDVAWACGILGLPRNAFGGADGSDPRLGILKSNETLDIEACPGSGKTTLLVAKLAILARKWADRRRGICVLSHTNVARREIDQRLGGAAYGKRLLAYPHFVGTIHGFINEFLALPWIRSKPLPIRMIDDETCQARRWSKLPIATQKALETNGYTPMLLKVAAADFSVGDVRWGKTGKLNKTTPTYQAIQAACRKASEEGFFCHDEMFLWGNELLDQVHSIRKALRERFPLLFIDEVQDNSELQSALLFRLFTEGTAPAVRQRFGDANQAIFQHSGQTAGASTDRFPDARIRKDIPNSHRFGQEIGTLANPLALEPQHLVGRGPCREIISCDTASKHAIFTFNDQTVQYVIASYAQYLLEIFSEQELRAGIFAAVGAVHRPPAQHSNLPRFVGKYWSDYDHELTAAEPQPRTFHQYLAAGRKRARAAGEAYFVVEKIAEGLLRLASLSNPLASLGARRRKHRYILELLEGKPDFGARYLELIEAFAVEGRNPTDDEWNEKWSTVISGIAQAIGGGPSGSDEMKGFLEWRASQDENQQGRQSRQRDNVFRYPAEQPRVEIRVGSIHSVKGETHTATLVLDTFYYQHSLATLKPWVLGQRSGRGQEGERNCSRLKQHYVAMTRPSHLLCLAMRADAFSEDEVTRLKMVPWRVARVTDATPVWL